MLVIRGSYVSLGNTGKNLGNYTCTLKLVVVVFNAVHIGIGSADISAVFLLLIVEHWIRNDAEIHFYVAEIGDVFLYPKSNVSVK